MKLKNDAFEQIKQLVSILDIAEHYGEVIKIGGVYKPKENPFRIENTSSVVLYQNTNSFADFGDLGNAGDIFNYVKLAENLANNKEALIRIVQIFHLNPDDFMTEYEQNYEFKYDKNREFKSKKIEIKDDDAKKLEFIAGREDRAKEYQKNFNLDLLEQYQDIFLINQIFKDKCVDFLGFDNNQNSLTIAIPRADGTFANIKTHKATNKDGSIQKWKSEWGGDVYPFPINLFNINCNLVLALEGEKDALNAIAIGFNAITMGGVANEFKEHIELLKDKDLVTFYDSDEAGYKASINKYHETRNIVKNYKFIPFFLIKENLEKGYDFSDLVLENKDFTKEQILEYAVHPFLVFNQIVNKYEKIKNNVDANKIKVITLEDMLKDILKGYKFSKKEIELLKTYKNQIIVYLKNLDDFKAKFELLKILPKELELTKEYKSIELLKKYYEQENIITFNNAPIILNNLIVKKSKTLSIVSNFEDFINLKICTDRTDIYLFSGNINELKNIVYNGNYSQVLVLQNRIDLAFANQILKIFDDKKILKKFYLIDWNKLDKKLEEDNVIGVTDLIKNLLKKDDCNVTDLRRELINIIKSSTKSLKKKWAIKQAKKLEIEYRQLLEDNAKDYFMHLKLKEVNKLLREFREDKTLRDAILPLQQNLIDKVLEETIIKPDLTLTVDNFITEAKDKILDFIEANNKILIVSAPGTGKSTFAKSLGGQNLIVTPIKALSFEFVDKNSFLCQNEDDIKRAMKYKKNMVMTTDFLYANYEIVFQTKFDNIIFDEQHLADQSKHFRFKVVNSQLILNKFAINETVKNFVDEQGRQVKEITINRSKLIYLTGTPIKDADDYKTIYIKTNHKIDINFDTTDEDIFTICKTKIALRDNSFIYNYQSTVARVNKVFNYIIERIKDTQDFNQKELKSDMDDKILDSAICMFTSSDKKIYVDGEIFEIKNLDEAYEKANGKSVIFIATSSLTTGVNLKYKDKELKHLIISGTTYTPQTFIQLINRIRVNGTVTYQNVISRDKQENIIAHTLGLFQILTNVSIANSQTSLQNLLERDNVREEFHKSVKHLPKDFSMSHLLLAFKSEFQILENYKIIRRNTAYIDGRYVTLDISINNFNSAEIYRNRDLIEEIETKKQALKIIADDIKYNVKFYIDKFNTKINLIVENNLKYEAKARNTESTKQEIEDKLQVRKDKKEANIELISQKFDEQIKDESEEKIEALEKLQKELKRVNPLELEQFFKNNGKIAPLLEVAVQEQPYLRLKTKLANQNGLDIGVIIKAIKEINTPQITLEELEYKIFSTAKYLPIKKYSIAQELAILLNNSYIQMLLKSNGLEFKFAKIHSSTSEPPQQLSA